MVKKMVEIIAWTIGLYECDNKPKYSFYHESSHLGVSNAGVLNQYISLKIYHNWLFVLTGWVVDCQMVLI